MKRIRFGVVASLLLLGLAGCRGSLQGRCICDEPTTTKGGTFANPKEARESAKGINYYLTRPTFVVTRKTGEDLAPLYEVEVGAKPDPTRRFEVGIDPGVFTSDSFELVLGDGGQAASLDSKRVDQFGATLTGVIKLAAAGGAVAAKALAKGAGSTQSDALAIITSAQASNLITTIEADRLTEASIKLDPKDSVAPLVSVTKVSLQDLKFPDDPSARSGDPDVAKEATAYLALEDVTLPVGLDLSGKSATKAPLKVRTGQLVEAMKLSIDAAAGLKGEYVWVIVDDVGFRPATVAAINGEASRVGAQRLVSNVGTLTSGSLTVAAKMPVVFSLEGWTEPKTVRLPIHAEEAREVARILTDLENFLAGDKPAPKTAVRFMSLAKLAEQNLKTAEDDANLNKTVDVSVLKDRMDLIDKVAGFLALLDRPAWKSLKDLRKGYSDAFDDLFADPESPSTIQRFAVAERELKEIVELIITADDNLKGRALAGRRKALTDFLVAKVPVDEVTFRAYSQIVDHLKQVLVDLDGALPASPKPKPYKQATDVTSRIDSERGAVKVHRPLVHLSDASIRALTVCAKVRLRLQPDTAVVIANPEGK